MRQGWIEVLLSWVPFFVLLIAWVFLSWWTGGRCARSGRTTVELHEHQLEEMKRNLDLHAQNLEATKRNTAALERIAQALENRRP